MLQGDHQQFMHFSLQLSGGKQKNIFYLKYQSRRKWYIGMLGILPYETLPRKVLPLLFHS